MILYTGGKYQGKLNILLSETGLNDDEVLNLETMEIKSETSDNLSSYKAIAYVEEYIRKLSEKNLEKDEIVNKVIGLHKIINPEYVIVTEVGCGVIPIKKSERIFREATGEVTTYFAKHAEEVYRVVCGIKTRIK